MLLDQVNIYAGFGNFCDWGGSNSRGWVLDWQAGTLNPLPANDLNNSQSSEPNNMFLSSTVGVGLRAGRRRPESVFPKEMQDNCPHTRFGRFPLELE